MFPFIKKTIEKNAKKKEFKMAFHKYDESYFCTFYNKFFAHRENYANGHYIPK